MATAMTNTVPGIVTFNNPIVMHVPFATGSKYDNVDKNGHSTQLIKAVKGTWTTNATGTDGKITVTSVLVVNEDQLQDLRSSVLLDTFTPGATTNPNIASIQ